jgi:hypothetical protein
MAKKLNKLGRKKRPKLYDDVIVIRVNKKLKRTFEKYCKLTGESAGRILRAEIIRLLRNVGL